MDFDFSVIWEALPDLWVGTELTIKITLLGLIGGAIVGALIGIVRAYAPSISDSEFRSRHPVAGVVLPVLAFIARLYVLLIRGTPMVVQVMFIYFAFPLLFQTRVDGVSAAIATLAVNSGAYISEIVRGSLLSVPRGLYEAGLAMGLPFHKIIAKIIGPIAFRRMIPALGNQCIISLKDTSIFIVIGVAELTRAGQEIMATNYRAVEIWGTVAFLYLILTGIIAAVLRIIEKRMRIL
ncbi:ABC transporter permease subunit [Pelistega europaea]|uniref:ABC transporter permease subunit n=1 Tax=Pelistega europaea TaxID=106147 RepID=A0A7Y4P5D9_9BURK|nr:ABC transporter permease subunit [Pelistega europaea]NOL50401.1 ABC transporter permease subunit [Pelistega europaea]